MAQVRSQSAAVRLLISVAAGVVAAVVTGAIGFWPFAFSVGWIVAGLLYLILNWVVIGPMDARSTERHATREDPARPIVQAVLFIASLASLGGVVLLLVAADSSNHVGAAVLGVLSVAVSWFVVHTLFTLRYAAGYYGGPDGGIDFNQKERPAYADFAYLGFTIGMTYQVSDTSISSPGIRRTALQHALVSYLLGAIVLAITLNLVVSLSGKS